MRHQRLFTQVGILVRSNFIFADHDPSDSFSRNGYRGGNIIAKRFNATIVSGHGGVETNAKFMKVCVTGGWDKKYTDPVL